MVPFGQTLSAQRVESGIIPRSDGTLWALERAVCGIALLAFLPVCALLALAIAVLSRRSPLIRHMRVGYLGSDLPLLKFRTMWDPDAEPGRFALIEDADGEVPATKDGSDARVPNAFAAFCRRHSLDELPQLWHITNGEMSLIGPRPITARELREHYGTAAYEVMRARPGLAGLWQVMGRNRLTYAQRRRLDLFLVRHDSPALCFRVFLRAIPAVLTGRDAY